MLISQLVVFWLNQIAIIMKKLFFLLSIFAIVLSCSSDETSTPVTPPPAPIAKYTITLSAGEGGTVSTTGGEYESGQTVNVTATPQGEYVFTSWSDGNTNPTRTITVSSNNTLAANFEKRKYALTLNFEGEGEVIEEIVNAGRTTDYDSGSTVKLTAQAAAEWVFIGWTGDIESTEESVQIVIGEPKEVTATFEKKKYPLTVNIEGEGEVLEEIINAGRTTDYDSGTTVKLTAEPADEWLFTGWSGDIGDLDPTENPIQQTIIESKTVTATFEKKKYPLTVNIEGEGEVLEEIVNSGRSTDYSSGTTVKLTANPLEGWGFSGWSGTISSTENPIQLTVDESKSITSTFLEFPKPIMTLVSSQTKMFTKGVADTLLISINSGAGFKSIELSSDWGDVSTVSSPEEGSLEGNLVVQYQSSQVKNVDYTRTIAGSDNLLITLTDQNDLTLTVSYTIRTQPEPIFKDYLKPAGVLEKSRVKINPALIRYLNQKDNSQELRCQYINGGLNQFGNLSDGYGGIAFADFNGDGYDDMFLHPVYSEGGVGGFSSVKTEYELYMYENGEYKYHQIDFGNQSTPLVYLAREILVGDYDNDGDPDLYSGNFGIDDNLGINTEKSLFIINNYNIDRTFGYKENPHSEGVHEASSADIDNDGDLDIYSRGRLGITQPYSPFFKNTGNFELEMWNYYGQDVNIFVDDINSSEPDWQYNYTRELMGSELIDVNKDGYVDLILVGFEWEDEFRVLWGSSSGFKTSDVSFIPQVETPASYDMGKATDIYVEDIDSDGVNEIIVVRTGGNAQNTQNNEGIFYRGWYLQILKLTNTKQLIDVTNTLIEDFYSDQPNEFCGNPYNNWIYWIVVDDYDNDGNLDIYNKMMSNRPLHRWEWSGSKFVKVSP